jgi:hypothetical protein
VESRSEAEAVGIAIPIAERKFPTHSIHAIGRLAILDRPNKLPMLATKSPITA